MVQSAQLMPAAGWTFACPDWEERLREGRSLIPSLPLDQSKAEKAVGVFGNLRLPDVMGQPRLAEACGEWFLDIVRVVFGSLDDFGVRHVPEILALLAKKQSKTTYAAGLMLTAMLLNKTPRAEILFVGPTQEIADQAFDQSQGMVEADPEGYLLKRFHIQDHRKVIKDRLTKARIKIKTFDMRVTTGTRPPLMVLLDELHIMGGMHQAGRVLRQIRGALESRLDSCLLMISTQSDQPPAGVFKSELAYARGVRDGRITGKVRLLPILYEFPAAMQTDEAKPWADPHNWPMVMPNLGRSTHLDTMIAAYQAECEKGEEHGQRWGSQHLNIEIGLALTANRWDGADFWEDAVEPELSLDALLDRCEVATVGIDGGGLDDLLGLSVLGREKLTRRWLLWVHAWAHNCVLDRRKEIAERLRDFEREGTLTLVEDDSDEDVQAVADLVERVYQMGLLPEKHGVGVDVAAISEIVDALELRGLATGVESGQGLVVGIRQGALSLTAAIKTLARRVAAHDLVHSGTALMDWIVGNVQVEPRGNALSITKQAAGIAKIDPFMALLNAAVLMAMNPQAAQAGITIGDDYRISA